MERLAGAVERFVCGSGGRVEVSKCRAVLGTAFAGVGWSWVVGVMTGQAVRGGIGWAWASGRLRKRSGALLVEDLLILWSAWVQESALWSGCSRRKRMRKVLERKAV